MNPNKLKQIKEACERQIKMRSHVVRLDSRAVLELIAEVERLKGADTLVSELHDLIYAKLFDREAASNKVWEVHEILREQPA